MQTKRKRILYVEDHQDSGEMVIAILRDHEVVLAGSKTEAQRRATEEEFDLYLLDYHLPDGTGMELCDFIRAFNSRTPILFCTGTKSLTAGQIEMAGAQGIVNKDRNFIDVLESKVLEFFSV